MNTHKFISDFRNALHSIGNCLSFTEAGKTELDLIFTRESMARRTGFINHTRNSVADAFDGNILFSAVHGTDIRLFSLICYQAVLADYNIAATGTYQIDAALISCLYENFCNWCGTNTRYIYTVL